MDGGIPPEELSEAKKAKLHEHIPPTPALPTNGPPPLFSLPSELFAFVLRQIPLGQAFQTEVVSKHWQAFLRVYLAELRSLNFEADLSNVRSDAKFTYYYDYRPNNRAITKSSLNWLSSRCPRLTELKLSTTAANTSKFTLPATQDLVTALEGFKSAAFEFDLPPGPFDNLWPYLVANVPKCLTYIHITSLADPLIALDLRRLENLRTLKIGHPEETLDISTPYPFGEGFLPQKLRSLAVVNVTFSCNVITFLSKSTPLAELTLDQSEMPSVFFASLLPTYELSAVTIKDCNIATDPICNLNPTLLSSLLLCGCSKIEARRVLPNLFSWKSLLKLSVGLTFIDFQFFNSDADSFPQMPQCHHLRLGGMSDLDHPDLVFVYGSLKLVDRLFPQLESLYLSDQVWIEWPLPALAMYTQLTLLQIEVVHSETTISGFLQRLPSLKRFLCEELQPTGNPLALASAPALEEFRIGVIDGNYLSMTVGGMPNLKKLVTQAHQFELVGLCPNLQELDVALPHNTFHPPLYLSLQWAPALQTLRVIQSPPFAEALLIQQNLSPYDSILQLVQGCLIPLASHRPIFVLHGGKPLAQRGGDSQSSGGFIFTSADVHFLRTVVMTKLNRALLKYPEQTLDLRRLTLNKFAAISNLPLETEYLQSLVATPYQFPQYFDAEFEAKPIGQRCLGIILTHE